MCTTLSAGLSQFSNYFFWRINNFVMDDLYFFFPLEQYWSLFMAAVFTGLIRGHAKMNLRAR